jgi:hypothetical protein
VSQRLFLVSHLGANIEMPPKKGGVGGTGKRDQSRDNQIKTRQPYTTNNDTQKITNLSTTSSDQSKFFISPLILEGVSLNKLRLNDVLKQHLSDIKVYDIQIARSGIFTIHTTDVNSFNRLLNDFTGVLVANGQPSANIYVPRSIQRIKYTEKVAFVKRVDLKMLEDRIADSLKQVRFNIKNVCRLTNREKNHPAQTIKIIFNGSQNRNTFVQTGLQIDSMHFRAEPAMENVTCGTMSHML